MTTLKLVVLAIAFAGLSVFLVVKQEQAKAQLEAERVQFAATLEQQKKKLKETREAAERHREALDRTREQIGKLERTLRRHDLAYLAKAKPCLIAKRMTAATRKAYQKIAETTGASIEELAGPDPKVCKA